MKDIVRGLSPQICQNCSESGRKYPPTVDKPTATALKELGGRSIDAR